MAKSWQRFREIPEWIDSQSSDRQVPPSIIIQELEPLRGDKGLNALQKEVKKLRETAKLARSKSQVCLCHPIYCIRLSLDFVITDINVTDRHTRH